MAQSLVALNVVSLGVLAGYLTYEYLWPALRRRFLTRGIIQEKLQVEWLH